MDKRTIRRRACRMVSCLIDDMVAAGWLWYELDPTREPGE
jgi:hypothetical protein